MNIDHLRTLLTVARTGSLTAAAAQLRMSQPGLSRQIKRMEADLGVKILARTASGVRLTLEGARLLEFAERTVAEYDDLLARSRTRVERLEGALRIIASTTPGEYLAPELAAAFSQKHPAVTAEVLVADSATVAMELLERRWDAGFTGRRSGDRRLRHVPVAKDEVVLAVPAGHRLAGRSEVDLAELEGERVIARAGGSGTQSTVQDLLGAGGHRLPPHSVVMSLGSTHAVVSAVDAGLGVGFVSSRALERHDATRILAVRLAVIPLVRDLYLVYETARSHPRLVRAFIDFVTGTGAT